MLDYDEEAQNFSIVPGCFLSTLKVVKFGKFAGKQRELCFAKFVMENARVLGRISFSCSRELQGLEMEKVKEKLVLVKRIRISARGVCILGGYKSSLNV